MNDTSGKDKLSQAIEAELRQLLAQGLRRRTLALQLPYLDTAATKLSRHPTWSTEGKAKELLESASKPMAQKNRDAVALLLDFAPSAADDTALKARRLAAARELGSESWEYFQRTHEARLLNELAACIASYIIEQKVDLVSALSTPEDTPVSSPRSELEFHEVWSMTSAYFKKRISKASDKFSFWLVVTVAIFLIVGIIGAAKSGARAETETREWGPERETFIWSHRPNHGTLNSATNNPELGNETRFISVGRAGTVSRTNVAIVHNHERLILRASFDNDAYFGNAQEVLGRFVIPNRSGPERVVTAYIAYSDESQNEFGKEVPIWANAYLFAPHPFRLTYIRGTEKLWTNGIHGIGLKNMTTSGEMLRCGTSSAGVITVGCVGSYTLEALVTFTG